MWWNSDLKVITKKFIYQSVKSIYYKNLTKMNNKKHKRELKNEKKTMGFSLIVINVIVNSS